MEKGVIISEDDIEKIEASGIDNVKVRSALTCETQPGICASCYGRAEVFRIDFELISKYFEIYFVRGNTKGGIKINELRPTLIFGIKINSLRPTYVRRYFLV